MTLKRITVALALALILTTSVIAQDEAPFRHDDDLLSPAFHRSRRDSLMAALPPGGVAVLLSAPTHVRSGDNEYEYHQDPYLYYLTGSIEPETVLFLAPSGLPGVEGRPKELMLVPEINPVMEVWYGRRFGPERAKKAFGMEATAGVRSFDAILKKLTSDPGTRIYLLPLPPDHHPESVHGRQQAALRGLIKAGRTDTKLLVSVLDRLRWFKTDDELRLMRKAVAITGEALREAFAAIEPGKYEYEIEALIEYTFRRLGAEDAAFASIVGSGENAVTLHYGTNRMKMEARGFVVMDVGAEVHGYAADVTRTVPVDGHFSDEERALYDLVLEASEAAIRACRAGVDPAVLNQVAGAVVSRGLVRLGILKDATQWPRFMVHGISHPLGLDVHDVAAPGPLQPGNVITIEPGIYIRPDPAVDPRWWNLGIRIEDDVLITTGDPEVLSADIPKMPAEIEALMSRPAK